jgi:hypothetical protein
MGFIEQYKKNLIRWYYGHFVNDPQAETFTFGLVRPYGAQRLTRILRRLRIVR